ncbi:MAG: VPLPA-CTERM sorting domain-containing protein [Pseudomonadales bacterium]|nr:VPLPA-CTERM sorting domain-containing protein [Pseudomonadales bacterium]
MFKKLAISSAIAMAALSTANAAMINEIEPNPAGQDPSTQFVELLGDVNTAYTGTLLSIESDGGSSTGRVDRIYDISGNFDSNGLLTVSIGDLENPSNTLILMDSFSGDTTTDIDLDNDGVADNLATFGVVEDALGVSDNNSDYFYGDDFGGVNLTNVGGEPTLTFRDANSLDWVQIVGGTAYNAAGEELDSALFNLDPAGSTFGAVNPEYAPVPVPAAVWLMLSGLGVVAGVRRKKKA